MFWQTVIKNISRIINKVTFLTCFGAAYRATGLWFVETAIRNLKAHSFHVHGRRVRTSRIRSIARWNDLGVGLNCDPLEQCGLVFHIENT
jgi:hypothetical protein